VIAKDRKVVAEIPDELVAGAYRAGYLRKAKFKSGLDGFVCIGGVSIGPPNGIKIIIHPEFKFLPSGNIGV